MYLRILTSVSSNNICNKQYKNKECVLGGEGVLFTHWGTRKSNKPNFSF